MSHIKAIIALLSLIAMLTASAADVLAAGDRSTGESTYRGRPRPLIARPGEAPAEHITVTPMIGPSAYNDIEIGAKASYRIADHGFIPAINNSVAVEGGVFLGFRHFVIEPLLRWDFHLHPEWTVYPAVGAAFVLGEFGKDGIFPGTVAVGGFWRPQGGRWVIRGEADWILGSLRAGPVFYF